MGYEFHITRAPNWTESKTFPIGLEEWKAYVASDLEFRLDNYAQASTPDGGVIRYDNIGLAVWTAYSGHGRDGNMAWFDHRDGRIVVKQADEEIRQKMKEIAKFFGARLVGDEDEEY
jgi:hypothetical protein